MSLRKNASTSEPPRSTNSRDIPASLAHLVARATPVKILSIDIDEPLPSIRGNDQYHDAYVVLTRNGACVGDAMANLTQGELSTKDQLGAAIAQLRARLIDEPERPIVPDSQLPRISIVVPSVVVRTEALQRCVESIEALDYPDLEFVLVDNRVRIPEDDPLPAIVEGRKSVRVVHEPQPGVSAARNAGVANADARSEIIAFVDDDVRVDPNWLREISTRFHMQPELDVVTGLILPAELESPAQVWYERYYGGFNGTRSFLALTLSPDNKGFGPRRRSRLVARDSAGVERSKFPVYGIGGYAAGANMAFRRSALERIEGFDNALGTGTVARGGEDLAAIISVLWTGGQLGFEPLAVAHHQHRREYEDLLRMLDSNGRGFTAMLTSLVLVDPRHLVGLASQASSVIRKFAVQGTQKLRGVTPVVGSRRPEGPGYPTMLARREFRAFVLGPVAYFRSRAVQRKQSALARSPSE